MRKDFITKDYKNYPKSGAINMKEVRNFASSKNMFVEESFVISDSFISEYISTPIKSDKQSTAEIQANPTWDFKLRHAELLKRYLYEQISLPPNDFLNINPTDTQNGNLNDAVKLYVSNNIVQLYKLNNIYMWTEYNNLILNTVTKGLDSYVLLKNKPIFNQTVKPLTGPYVKGEKLTIAQDKTESVISYKQSQDAETYMYFYNFEFEFVRI